MDEYTKCEVIFYISQLKIQQQTIIPVLNQIASLELFVRL